MKKKPSKYFNVVKVENADSAEILIYGVIGQEYWWRENQEENLTDLEIIKAIRELESEYSVINIRINSPGGSMYHGNAIISAIRSSKAEIHTYNDGMAASMAGLIWMASEHRHMSSNALLMIHAPITGVYGNAEDLRHEIEVLDKFESTAVTVLSESTDMTAEEIKSNYFDYKDHWLNAADCKAAGFISEVEKQDAEDIIESATEMSFLKLVEAFSKKGDTLATQFLNYALQLPTQAIKAITSAAPTPSLNTPNLTTPNLSNPQTDIDMKKDDLITSFKAGDLNADDLSALLTEAGYEIKPPEEETEPTDADLAATIATAVQAALKPLTDQVTALEAKVNTYGKLPGATITQTQALDANLAALTPEQQAMVQAEKAFAQQLAQAGKGGGNPYINKMNL